MSKVVFISKRRIQWYIVAAVLLVLGVAYLGWQRSEAVSAPLSSDTQVFQLVTGEFNSTTESGKQLESYIWAPGTITVNKGKPVELRITGVSGQSHPFTIEGLNIKGTVTKGKTTIVRFTPEQAGTYAMVCDTHSDASKGIPMIGYITVQ